MVLVVDDDPLMTGSVTGMLETGVACDSAGVLPSVVMVPVVEEAGLDVGVIVVEAGARKRGERRMGIAERRALISFWIWARDWT